ncbi:type I methionyl aminopeptidase, partial [Candidatus Dojkabacteria bacterium]|nr:type I methionyl aminopeptidase [Candidatus Dojkabacteria bacterium]
KYKKIAELSTEIIKKMSEKLEVGIYPAEIEKYCWELCRDANVEPAFYGVVQSGNPPFPSSCNINVNDEILHAIPSSTRKLEKGDVVKIDFGITSDGLFTDHCYTFVIEEMSEEDRSLVMNAKLATETAMKKAIVGNTTGDLGETMEAIAEMAGFEVLKNYVGHGIGKTLWEEPSVPAYGLYDGGDELEEGMVLCIECQLVKGTDRTYIESDGWTIKTSNGNKGAMFEYMVVVGKNKPIVLTPMQDWKIVI